MEKRSVMTMWILFVSIQIGCDYGLYQTGSSWLQIIGYDIVMLVLLAVSFICAKFGSAAKKLMEKEDHYYDA